MTVDLPNQAVTGPDGKIHHFEIEPLSKKRLLRGLDEIAHTLEYGDAIRRFEEGHGKSLSVACGLNMSLATRSAGAPLHANAHTGAY